MLLFSERMVKDIKEIIAENIKRYRVKRGLTQRELGLSLGYPESDASARIGQYEKCRRSPSKETLEKLCAIFNITMADLVSPQPNVEHATLPAGKQVPLISWVQAGSWHEPFDPYPVGQGSEWVSADTADPNAFALRVVGDSMEPEFSEGNIIIVSPAIEPASGDYAIVKVNGEVTFKRIQIYLSRVVLQPLNTRYESQEILFEDGKQIKIIGKVIQKIVKY